jgi:hypothetical protein
MSALLFFRYHYHFFVVLIIGTLFTNCNKNLAGTEVTNEEAVKLVGKVLDQKGAGVPNIIAKIDKLHVADTTDNGGNYSFTISSNALKNMGIVLDTIKDSVRIYNTGNVVSVLAITKWIDTLPQVYLIQRNIYGTLVTDSSDFKNLEAVLTIYNSDDSIVGRMIKKLWFNNGTKGFSGFIYFPTNSADLKYSVYINVYNKDSLLTGMSKTVFFDDLAGDIEIPGFNPYTCDLQISIGEDTTLTIKDTIKLSIQRSGDSLSKIIKYEWNFNNKGFIVSSSNIGTFVLPDTECVIQCIGKATDEFGNVAFDTIQITCSQDKPYIYIWTDFPLRFGSEGKIRAGVSDLGRIVSWKWKINDGLPFKQSDSINASTVSITVPNNFSPLFCELTVIDDDNNQVTKSIELSTGEWKKTSSFQSNYNNKVFWALNNDSIFLGTQEGNEFVFYHYDQNFVAQPIFNKIQVSLPRAFLVSTAGDKYLVTLQIPSYLNYAIYKAQNDSFVFQDSLDEVVNFPGFTTIDNGTLCISSVKSDVLTICSYSENQWIKKSVDLSSSSGQPIVSSLVSIGNTCYIAVGAERKQPFLYKYNGNVITPITIGNYQSFNYLSVNSDGENLYVCGNYYGSNDSIYTFIHKLKNNLMESVVTDIGGLYSVKQETMLKTVEDKSIIEVTAIDSSLYLGVNNFFQETMRSPTNSPRVFRLRGNKLEQIGNAMLRQSGAPPLTQMKIFKKNSQLHFISEGNVYRLE